MSSILPLLLVEIRSVLRRWCFGAALCRDLLPGRRLGAGVVLGHVAGQCWGPMLDCDGGVSLKPCFDRWLPWGTLLDFAGARCRGVPKSRDMLVSGKWRGRGAFDPGGGWQLCRGGCIIGPGCIDGPGLGARVALLVRAGRITCGSSVRKLARKVELGHTGQGDLYARATGDEPMVLDGSQHKCMVITFVWSRKSVDVFFEPK